MRRRGYFRYCASVVGERFTLTPTLSLKGEGAFDLAEEEGQTRRCASGSELDDALLEGLGDGLGAMADVHLAEDVGDVSLDGAFAYQELCGNLPVG